MVVRLGYTYLLFLLFGLLEPGLLVISPVSVACVGFGTAFGFGVRLIISEEDTKAPWPAFVDHTTPIVLGFLAAVITAML